MNLRITSINFCGKPKNYAVVDQYVSRSAQPKKEDIAWLKEQGVTDIFNFRTMRLPNINYDEKAEAEKMGIKYHSIPSVTKYPKEENIELFLKEIEEVKQRGGKAHIHCRAGADRTGMYTFIYKMVHGLDSFAKNQAEWLEHGFHYKRYPDLMDWTKKFIQKKF